MKLRTVDVAPFCFRAALATVDAEARTADLTFSTGAAVERYDYMQGVRYTEVLSMKPAHVRLDRLNAGASLLNSHQAYDLASVLGAVEPKTARIDGGEGVARVRFSRRADVEPYFQDVRDGIIRFVSVGYRVYKFLEEAGKNGAAAIRTAVDWEPFEISMVAMPADAGAKVRAEAGLTNACVIVTQPMTDADRIRRFRLAMARH